MDLFFMCMRAKQRIYIDVGQGATVENIEEMIRQLLELPEKPRLMKPKHLLDPKDRADISAIEWEQMQSDKTLSSYGYNKDTALAHEPVPLAFLLSGDTEPVITPLSNPRPIPEVPQDADANSST